jgi:hypothetical protein
MAPVNSGVEAKNQLPLIKKSRRESGTLEIPAKGLLCKQGTVLQPFGVPGVPLTDIRGGLIGLQCNLPCQVRCCAARYGT